MHIRRQLGGVNSRIHTRAFTPAGNFDEASVWVEKTPGFVERRRAIPIEELREAVQVAYVNFYR